MFQTWFYSKPHWNILLLFKMYFSCSKMTGIIPECVGNLSTSSDFFCISYKPFHITLLTSLNSLKIIKNINDNHFTSVSGVEEFFTALYYNTIISFLEVRVQWTIIHGDVPFPARSCQYATPCTCGQHRKGNPNLNVTQYTADGLLNLELYCW